MPIASQCEASPQQELVRRLTNLSFPTSSPMRSSWSTQKGILMDKTLYFAPYTRLYPQPDTQCPVTAALLIHHFYVPVAQRHVVLEVHHRPVQLLDDDGEVLEGEYADYILNITTCN